MASAAPTVEKLLSTLTKPRLVDLGRQFGVAVAKPNGVPANDSVKRLVQSGQLVFRDLLDWMEQDELRRACKTFGLDHRQRSRKPLTEALLRAHGTPTAPPPSIFGDPKKRHSMPATGDIVKVRHRQYLVEAVTAPEAANELTRVDLVCLDDDQQGRALSVLWELELGAEVCHPHEGLGKFERIDPPRHFAAYLHALEWHSVTATDAAFFQAPFRAGIRLMNHQLIPLKKALELPRCNLFIADDVGLGKTIEAGLVMQELQLRQRVQFMLIVCPASICLQWQREMERRFGLRFEIYDRAFVSRRRQERGFGVNAWSSHQRFIVSYHTLKRPEHREPLFQHLGPRLKKSLLVLDEAHTVAPAGPGRYAVDSELTTLVQRLAPAFENRLFLSATPHNGHSNSFSTLLELLDPQRFTRGVPVEAGSKVLGEVMVRRLKRDLQEAALGSFPKRHVVRVALRDEKGGLSATFGEQSKVRLDGATEAGLPELRLSALLAEYSEIMRPSRGPGRFVFVNLQKRLLSSVEAFKRTLDVHVKRLEERFGANVLSTAPKRSTATAAEDDEQDRGSRLNVRAVEARDQDEDELDREVDAESARATSRLRPPTARARELLREMLNLAERTRHAPDAKVLTLISWMREHLCAGIGLGQRTRAGNAPWSSDRVIIFTEYADTKRYLTELLQNAVRGTALAEQRIMGFHGAMSDDERERVQDAFNGDPGRFPVRILIATDAAREGLNLQNHCKHLFHFDIPWNPARLEQRNGRIDRTLQPSPEVWCHYFVYPERAEDAVLERLVKKVDVIQRELGTLGDIVMHRLEKALELGIGAGSNEALAAAERPSNDQAQAVHELESQRATLEKLRKETEDAAEIQERSAERMRFSEDLLREAVNVGLELATGGQCLEPISPEALREQALETSGEVYRLPPLPPSWARTLDSLRSPREGKESESEWRRRPLQPVVFKPLSRVGEDRVHLHLEHPVVQRLLSRFLAQGYSAHDLSRVTIVPSDKDARVRVLAFGRLSLFGPGATRLHDEVLSIAAPWFENRSEGHLKPFADQAERRALDNLDRILSAGATLRKVPAHIQKKVLENASADFAALWPAVKKNAEQQAKDALAQLTARGEQEAKALRRIIEGQRTRIEKAQQLALPFEDLTPRELEQLHDEREHMKERLARIDRELQSEPEELKALYRVALQRLEPVGLVYLWPTTRL